MSNGFIPDDQIIIWPPKDEQQPRVPEIYTEVLHWEIQEGIRVATVSKYGSSKLRTCTSLSSAVYFAGDGVTNADGKWDLDLSKIMCLESRRNLGKPSIVATPLSRYPRLLTTTFELSSEKLLIEVRSWMHNGKNAGLVSFNWHCVVPAPIILI